MYNLGLVLHEMDRLEEAEGIFRRLCDIDPRDVDALIHLGLVYCKRSRFPDGERTFRQALERAPRNPILWMYLGNACHEIQGRLDEAFRCLQKCIELEPGLAPAHYQLGIAYRKLGKPGAAATAFRRALELEPDSADALDGLGRILQDEGRLDEAIEHYRAALRHVPDSAACYNGLGCALAGKDRLEEAAECLRKSLSLQRDSVVALRNLGNVYSLQGARDQARHCFEQALLLRPDDAAIRECLLYEMQHMCDWSRLEELCELQRRAVFERPWDTVSPFSLLSIPSSRAEQLQCGKNFAQLQLRAVARDGARFAFQRRPAGRLRIAYLSADFHAHATAYLMAEMFELHDRRRFEISAYSYGPDDGSPMRARLRRAFDRFTDIGALSHAAAAAAIHAAGTDILVDLKGYTQNARTGIVALRPAPVQASFIGYPGTMGAEFIDYLVADRFVTPPEHAADYSEKLVLMPGSYQVNDRKRFVAAAPPRRELGLPEQGFVFCCFNQSYKILRGTFDVWMRLLRELPSAVLWLLESNPWAAENLRREARDRGVVPERLIFAPKLPVDQHLGRMGAANLFLDTWPYNAHTTASDALWVGLPVLTLPGDTFASRVAGSLLSAAGMPELIAGSAGEYEALALGLARDPGRLAALRDRLGRNRATSALFDTPAFTRNLETAYEQMWQRYLAGEAPGMIHLPPAH